VRCSTDGALQKKTGQPVTMGHWGPNWDPKNSGYLVGNSRSSINIRGRLFSGPSQVLPSPGLMIPQPGGEPETSIVARRMRFSRSTPGYSTRKASVGWTRSARRTGTIVANEQTRIITLP